MKLEEIANKAIFNEWTRMDLITFLKEEKNLLYYFNKIENIIKQKGFICLDKD